MNRLHSTLGMVVLSNARGPLGSNVTRSQASDCGTYHSFDVKSRLVVRSGQLLL